MNEIERKNEVVVSMMQVELGDEAEIRRVHKMIDVLMDDGVITMKEHREMCALFTSLLKSKHYKKGRKRK